MSLTLTLASRNLFHDSLRLVATLVGIVFSVVLVMIQMGLFLGFGHMVTNMIDHTSTDLWVVPKKVKCFEDPSLIDLKLRNRIVAIDGIATVIPLVIGFSDWRQDSGEMTPVFIVGADLHDGALRPWNVVDGDVQALSQGYSVAVDRTYFDRLGVTGIGSTAEIRGRKVKVVALTDGIRSFTTTPYVFVDLKNARTFTGTPSDRANDLLVRLSPDADRDKTVQAIRDRVGVRGRRPAHGQRARGRRQHAAEDQQQRGLAASGRAHQQRQFAAFERQIDAAQRLHLARTAAQRLCHLPRFYDKIAHRMNTVAGSVRSTRTIAPIADITHMATVNIDSATNSHGVITIGNALFAVIWTTTAPMA